MANNCNNIIIVSGDDTTKINDMFHRAMEYNNEYGYGWLPEDDDIEALDYQHYLFDVERQDKDVWRCWTKWSPPVDEFLVISRSYPSVTFHMEWEEPGFSLYGRCSIADGVLVSLVELTDEELEQVQYDEDNDHYVWTRPDGTVETFECDSEIYDMMLDGKEDKV